MTGLHAIRRRRVFSLARKAVAAEQMATWWGEIAIENVENGLQSAASDAAKAAAHWAKDHLVSLEGMMKEGLSKVMTAGARRSRGRLQSSPGKAALEIATLPCGIVGEKTVARLSALQQLQASMTAEVGAAKSALALARMAGGAAGGCEARVHAAHRELEV